VGEQQPTKVVKGDSDQAANSETAIKSFDKKGGKSQGGPSIKGPPPNVKEKEGPLGGKAAAARGKRLKPFWGLGTLTDAGDRKLRIAAQGPSLSVPIGGGKEIRGQKLTVQKKEDFCSKKKKKNKKKKQPNTPHKNTKQKTHTTKKKKKKQTQHPKKKTAPEQPAHTTRGPEQAETNHTGKTMLRRKRRGGKSRCGGAGGVLTGGECF